MVVHSPVGYRNEGKPARTLRDRQLRRLQKRIAHLAALLRLNAVRGTGKFPSGGNLGGKNGRVQIITIRSEEPGWE